MQPMKKTFRMARYLAKLLCDRCEFEDKLRKRDICSFSLIDSGVCIGPYLPLATPTDSQHSLIGLENPKDVDEYFKSDKHFLE